MATIIELMMAIRDKRPVFYHRSTNQFDYYHIPKEEIGKWIRMRRFSIVV